MLSMTGYGRGACEVAGRRVSIEIRAVNHRFFDLKLRLPWSDAAFEQQLTQALRRRIDRGAVGVSARDAAGGVGAATVTANVALARAYAEALDTLRGALGLSEAIPLALVAGMRDVLVAGEGTLEGEALWREVEPAVEEALAGLVEMRRREGAALRDDVVARAARLEALGARMGTLAADAPADHRQRLRERLERVLGAGEVDPQRLAQEVAIFADRCDIAEEITRLGSHLAQLRGLCDEPGAVGRKLEFLLQELNREVNTIGSKGQSAELARCVVEAKAELERLREQVQNVE